MQRLVSPRQVLTIAGLGLLAACADQSTAPMNDAASTGGTMGVTAGTPAGQFLQRGQTSIATPYSRPAVLLTYHNGPVLKASSHMAIFWGPQWTNGSFPSDVVSGLDQFFGGWSGSNYNKINTEYGDATSNITINTTYLGHAFDGSTPPTAALTTAQAVAEACKITGDSPDPNGIYVIYTPTFPSNVNYCAWHSWGNCSTGAPVQVAYEPNQGGVAGCDPQDPSTTHSQMLEALANTTAHEVAEAETDPRGTGWYDRQGAENADKCAWKFNGTVTLSNASVWKLQENWSNNAKGCVQGN